MSVSEEEQVRAMLEAMGVPTLDDLGPTPDVEVPVPDTSPAHQEPPKDTRLDAAELTKLRAVEPGGRRHEPGISTLVHLLGVSTASQSSVIESKLDLLTVKIGALTRRLERIEADLDAVKNEASIDRIAFQISEMHAIFKRTLAGDKQVAKPAAEKAVPEKKKPVVLTSQPVAAATPEAEPAAAPVETPAPVDSPKAEEALTNAAFQAAEAQRIRKQTS